MAGITLEQAQARLTSYLAAETAVLANQEYEINGKRFRRSNLAEIQKGIAIWNARVQRLTRGGIRVRTVEVDE